MNSTNSIILNFATVTKIWHIFNWYILPSAVFLTLVFLVEWKSSNYNMPREPVLCPRHSALYISSCNRRARVQSDEVNSSVSDHNITIDEDSRIRQRQRRQK